MRIGEAAAAAGLTPRALRYYEQEGLLGARRTPSGHREYGPEEVRRLRVVRELREAGLTVADVRAFAHVLDRSSLPGPEEEPEDITACPVADVTLRRLADLDRRIERLTTLRARLAEALDHRFSEQFADAPRKAPSPRHAPAAGPAAQSTPRMRTTSTAPSSPTPAETR